MQQPIFHDIAKYFKPNVFFISTFHFFSIKQRGVAAAAIIVFQKANYMATAGNVTDFSVYCLCHNISFTLVSDI